MKYKVEELIDKIKEQFAEKKATEMIMNINDDESDIMVFSYKGLNAFLGYREAVEVFDEILTKTICAMNQINVYAKCVGMEDIFVFDEDDPKSVLSVSNNYLYSCSAYNMENEEEDREDEWYEIDEKIETLKTRIKELFPEDEAHEILKNIKKNEDDIITFFISDEDDFDDKETMNDLRLNTVLAMKEINGYARTVRIDDIFIFDENNQESILERLKRAY